MATNFRQTYSDAQRKQMLADQLAQQATIPIQRPQGRQAANTGFADGLTMLGQALASRRAGKQASTLGAAADEQRRKAQAAALSGMANPPNLVETQAAQNPYARAQGALEAEVDPRVVGAYLKSQDDPGAGRKFGVVNPSDFTPESLEKFSQTQRWGDLVPRNNTFGRYNPRDYTPESWAKFQQTNDPAMLQRYAERELRDNPGGGVDAYDPITGQKVGSPRTAEEGTQQSAARKAAEAQAGALGEAQGKALGAYMSRATNAQGVQEILSIAEPIIEEATGSGAGKYRDQIAAFFGVSTGGAQGIAQLAPLQAALMMSMPRMEGPQSDRDVELYRKAAGEIGDPAVPRETKLAAIKTIRELHQRYAQMGGGGLPPIIPNSASPTPQAAPAAAPQSGVQWSDL